MHRKFNSPSPEFEAQHMAEQERILDVVERRQADKTKKYDAGKLMIMRAQEKADEEKEW